MRGLEQTGGGRSREAEELWYYVGIKDSEQHFGFRLFVVVYDSEI
jgi:hypothetical protein